MYLYFDSEKIWLFKCIRSLHSAPSARIKINGHLSQIINLERGCRQGYPLAAVDRACVLSALVYSSGDQELPLQLPPAGLVSDAGHFLHVCVRHTATPTLPHSFPAWCDRRGLPSPSKFNTSKIYQSVGFVYLITTVGDKRDQINPRSLSPVVSVFAYKRLVLHSMSNHKVKEVRRCIEEQEERLQATPFLQLKHKRKANKWG